MQPKLRQATNVDSVHGAQVDPFIPRRITEDTPFVLFGFCNVLVRARRCLDALACITTVDLTRRYELEYTRSARLATREVKECTADEAWATTGAHSLRRGLTAG